jgi:hypothetical protein
MDTISKYSPSRGDLTIFAILWPGRQMASHRPRRIVATICKTTSTAGYKQHIDPAIRALEAAHNDAVDRLCNATQAIYEGDSVSEYEAMVKTINDAAKFFPAAALNMSSLYSAIDGCARCTMYFFHRAHTLLRADLPNDVHRLVSEDGYLDLLDPDLWRAGITKHSLHPETPICNHTRAEYVHDMVQLAETVWPIMLDLGIKHRKKAVKMVNALLSANIVACESDRAAMTKLSAQMAATLCKPKPAAAATAVAADTATVADSASTEQARTESWTCDDALEIVLTPETTAEQRGKYWAAVMDAMAADDASDKPARRIMQLFYSSHETVKAFAFDGMSPVAVDNILRGAANVIMLKAIKASCTDQTSHCLPWLVYEATPAMLRVYANAIATDATQQAAALTNVARAHTPSDTRVKVCVGADGEAMYSREEFDVFLAIHAGTSNYGSLLVRIAKMPSRQRQHACALLRLIGIRGILPRDAEIAARLFASCTDTTYAAVPNNSVACHRLVYTEQDAHVKCGIDYTAADRLLMMAAGVFPAMESAVMSLVPDSNDEVRAQQTDVEALRLGYTCAECNAQCGVKKSACGNCKCVRYCSSGCQRKHWDDGHSHLCRAYATAAKTMSEM